MSEKHLEDWYKESFENLSETPPPDVWEGISDGLKGADGNKRAGGGYWRIIVLLLLLAAPAYFIYNAFDAEKLNATAVADNVWTIVKSNPIDNTPKHQGNNHVGVASTSENVKVSSTEDNVTKKEGTVSAFTVSKNDVKSIPNINRKASKTIRKQQKEERKQQRTESTVVIANNTGIQSKQQRKQLLVMKATPIRLPGIFRDKRERLVARDNGDVDDYVSVGPDHILPQGYYIGATGTYSNLWGLNHDTYNGFSKHNENIKNELDFGFDYGVFGGVNVNDKWGIQSEFLFKKNQGQTFVEFVERQPVNTTISLDYIQFNVQYIRKWAKITGRGHARSINALAGPYLGYLMNATRTRTNDNFQDDYAFVDFDFGIDVGLEYQYYFKKNWSATGGIETALGFVNVYAGDGKIPRDFNRTRNLSIGARLGVTYHLAKKAK